MDIRADSQEERLEKHKAYYKGKLCPGCEKQLHHAPLRRGQQSYYICPRCLFPRRAGSFDKSYPASICRVCRELRREERKKLRRIESHLYHLASGRLSDDEKIQIIAQVCTALVENLSWQGLRRMVAEVLEPLAFGKESYDEQLLKRRRRFMMSLVYCLAALSILRDERLRHLQLEAKAVEEMTTEELKEVVRPLCEKRIADNPNLAINCLDRTGYDVTIRPKEKKPRYDNSSPPHPQG